MQCENCNSFNFLTVSDEEMVCTDCGLLREIVNEIYNDNVNTTYNKKVHRRCIIPESLKEKLLKKYYQELKDTWNETHFKEVQIQIQNNLNNLKKNQKDSKNPNKSISETSIIVGTVLKYAYENKIPCNYKSHKKSLKVAQKRLNTVFVSINAGIISEGMCKTKIREILETKEEIGSVRPTHMQGNTGHQVTRELACYFKDTSLKRVEICNGNMTQDIINKIYSLNQEVQEEINAGKNHLMKFSNLEKNEGTNVLTLVCNFIVLKKRNIEKNQKTFCNKTRMISTPTFSKILKQYKKYFAIYL
tara:strand:+ start:2112 stop:3020 length:909 start_codon:yes stop_codon:yes gene_type:complete